MDEGLIFTHRLTGVRSVEGDRTLAGTRFFWSRIGHSVRRGPR